MGKTRKQLSLLCAALLGLAGCQMMDPNPVPKLREVAILPPSDDARFSSPPSYPKEVLDTGSLKKSQQKNDMLKGPGSFQGPGGMRQGGAAGF